MANTYTLIASNTVGSGGASNITFNSIPQTYTDLVIRLSARTAATSVVDNLFIRFNGSSSNYRYRFMYGTGAAVGSSIGTDSVSSLVNGNNATASTFSNTEWYIPNYAGGVNKGYLAIDVSENNGTTAYLESWGHLWSDTSAITSIALTSTGSVNFLQHTTAYLYGIKNS
jgi:hypothetical protein